MSLVLRLSKGGGPWLSPYGQEHVAEELLDFSIILDIGHIRCLIDENMLWLFE
jgi:hypothetical protein